MPQFRKKPVVVEAFLWTGGPDQTEDPVWAVEATKAGNIWFSHSNLTGAAIMLISTIAGVITCNQGDYLIKGVKGEIYPCKADIFELTYEAV